MDFGSLVAIKFPNVRWDTSKEHYCSVSDAVNCTAHRTAEQALKKLRDTLVGEQFCTAILQRLRGMPALLSAAELVAAFYADLADIYAGVRPKGVMVNKHTGSVYFLIAKDENLAVGLRFYVGTNVNPLNTVGADAYKLSSYVVWRLRVMRVDTAAQQGIEERAKGVSLPVTEACIEEELVIAEPPKVKKKVKSRAKTREQ